MQPSEKTASNRQCCIADRGDGSDRASGLSDAANWVASLRHNAEISGYVRRVDETPSAERLRILNSAYEYNQQLTPGPLTDPYVSLSEDEALQSEVYLAYAQLLKLSGTDTIGTVNYPRLGIGLPVFHGTSDDVISKGIGHLYGTSLPVGGPSTRSVLTAHSGLPNARLFSTLLDAQIGDEFWISVLGEDHYYQVRSVETVLPGQTESLQIIDGEDWVTLFTCTPISVNSHRLMVHAQRIDASDGVTDAVLPGDAVKLGFPWWAAWFIGGSVLVAGALFFEPKRRKSKRTTNLR